MLKADQKKKSHDLQDKLLQKLNEYGDSILDVTNEVKKKKEKRNSVVTDLDAIVPETASFPVNSESISDNTVRKRKGKKKKKKTTSDGQNAGAVVKSGDDKLLTGKDKQLELIKKQLGLTDFKNELDKKKEKENEIKAQKSTTGPEVVVFTTHKSKKKAKGLHVRTVDGVPIQDDNPEFDLKTARFEVLKFGIKGFQGDKKEEAMTSMLVKLGAKPPKNKYINYKELQENRKHEILAEKDKRDMERKLGYKVTTKKATKRPRDRNDIGHVDGQIGKFKSGVQYVKMDDIKKFKKSKTK